MRRQLLCFVMMLLTCDMASGQSTDEARLQWFSDARLGIFIHWGIYAVNGTSESWSFHNRETSYPDYMKQLRGFTASKFDPDAWAELIVASGARYAVITMQHHDGVALYDTRQLTPCSVKGLWNVRKPLSVQWQSPAGRDVVTPFAEALRKKNIRFGAYYSLLDWSHDDYPGFFKDEQRYKIADDSLRWKRFLGFMHAQIQEINTQFHPDLFWFDGDWEHSEEEWDAAGIEAIIHRSNPNALLNGRLKSFGDYQTPEQNMPVVRPTKSAWELCITTNNNWGYRPADTAWKSPLEIIHIFCEVLSMGGNMLLDIGPRADGTIPEEQAQILTTLGQWIGRNSEAVYGSREGLPYGHYHGASTLSRDSQTVYLFVPSVQLSTQSASASGYATVMIKGLRSGIKFARVLGNSVKLSPKTVGKISWSSVPGTVFMEVPVSSMDPYMTVVELQLDGPLQLYRGQGGFQ